MTDDAWTPPEADPRPRPYRPPQQLLIPCPKCRAMVLRGLFIKGHVKKQSPPLTPVLGEPHVCATAQRDGATS